MGELSPSIDHERPSGQQRLVTSRIDFDGVRVMIERARESAATMAALTTRESLSAEVAGVRTWTKITTEPISDLLCWKITETRPVPGNAVTKETKLEVETLEPVQVTQTLKTKADITTQAVVSGTGATVKLTYTDMISFAGSNLVAIENVMQIGRPAAYDEASALQGTRLLSYPFPGRLSIPNLDLYGTAIGYVHPRATLTLADSYTYWVISDTKPTITFQEILPANIMINNVQYEDVLHDATTRFYNGLPVSFPATTPSYTEYMASWINQKKTVDGNVQATKFQKLWQITLFKIKMR